MLQKQMLHGEMSHEEMSSEQISFGANVFGTNVFGTNVVRTIGTNHKTKFPYKHFWINVIRVGLKQRLTDLLMNSSDDHGMRHSGIFVGYSVRLVEPKESHCAEHLNRKSTLKTPF
jgi:hypothetical protein